MTGLRSRSPSRRRLFRGGHRVAALFGRATQGFERATRGLSAMPTGLGSEG